MAPDEDGGETEDMVERQEREGPEALVVDQVMVLEVYLGGEQGEVADGLLIVEENPAVGGRAAGAEGYVAVSSRFAGNEGVKSLDEFIAQITEEIASKTIREEIPQEERK